MNQLPLLNWLLWSFAATLVLTSILAAGRSLRFTRMDITFMLGTIVTPDRDRAKSWGFLFHVIDGWIFGFLYAIAFLTSGIHGTAFGALLGLVHALIVLTAGMALLPSLHPRMATEQQGPNLERVLEPPGFFALHYGRRTPIATVVAHVIYGGILGTFL